MAKEYVAKPLKPSCLQMDGISAEQITQHYELLYKGYVAKVNEIWQRLETVERSKANQTFSDLRACKSEESFALNGCKLHEYYFDNLGGQGGAPGSKLAELIARDFGSFEAWLEDFKATGMTSRGWVILAWDPDIGILRNFGHDAHNVGVIVNAAPILVMDTYEHGYGIDYGVKRPPYIEAFVKNIDWAVAEARLAALGL